MDQGGLKGKLSDGWYWASPVIGYFWNNLTEFDYEYTCNLLGLKPLYTRIQEPGAIWNICKEDSLQ